MKEVTCIVSREWWALTRGKKYPILEEDEAERRVRVCGDDGCVRWSPMYCFDMTGDSRSLQPYTLWIEAEEKVGRMWLAALLVGGGTAGREQGVLIRIRKGNLERKGELMVS